MNNRILAGGLALLVLLGGGMAAAQPGRGEKGPGVSRTELLTRLDARFSRLDANGDGNISAADRDQAVEARFKQLDADGNGAITLAEMKEAEAKRLSGPDDPNGSGGGRRHAGRRHGGPGLAGGADGNGDGMISKAEFEASALAGFDRADANHDGILTPAERHQARAEARAAKAR